MTSVSPQLGVPALDKRLAPIPPHAAVLLTNEPGADPLPILHQSVVALVNEGRRVIYCAIDRPASSVNLQLLGAGMDPALGERSLVFVDGYSRGSGLAGDAPTWPGLLRPSDMAASTALLQEIAGREASSILVLDSLSAFADEAADVTQFLHQLPELLGALRRFDMSLSVFTAWPYATSMEPMGRGFDAVVALHGLHARTRFADYFTIEHVDWRANAKRPVAYKVRAPHGVIEYIPKILVTGPGHAGKSTFVQNVSQTASSVNRLGTTVVLDHGHLLVDDFVADVFGTAGQSRFDALLTMLAGSAMGIVLVVDSTDAHSLKRARALAQATRAEGIPLIVAANKQDLEDALTPKEIAFLLGFPSDVMVMGCTARDPASCRSVLTQLVRRIREPEAFA